MRGGPTCLALVSLGLLLRVCPAGAPPTGGGGATTTYRLKNAEQAHTEAVAFDADGSTLAIVQWLNIKASGFPTELTVWDFRQGKVVLKERILGVNFHRRAVYAGAAAYLPGGHELAVCGIGGGVEIFSVPGYRQIADIPLGPPGDAARGPFVVDNCATSADGTTAAYELRQSPPAPSHRGMEGTPITIQVFDLSTHKQTGQWTFPVAGNVLGWGAAVSPSGERIAWASTGEHGERGRISVLDVASGRVVSIHAGDVETPPAFSSDGRLLSVYAGPAIRSTAHQGIRIWDATTGKLLRKTSSPPHGVHYVIQVSADGRVVLGYTGTDTPYGDSYAPDNIAFRLWDTGSWRVLYASPHLPYSRRGGWGALPPQYTLSRDGHLVASWGDHWDNIVYEIDWPAQTRPAPSQH